MSGSTWMRKWGVLGFCAALSAALNGQAFAEGLVIGGYVQGSYQVNLGKPKDGSGNPTGNQLRSFDASQDDDFSVNQVQLNALKAVGDDRYGYGVKLLFGRDAAGLGQGVFDVAVEEAYAMYSPEKLRKLTFTGGKFVTMEGVEIIESPLNLNITEGLLFGLAEAYTHVGAKAAYAISDKATVMAGVVNGWDVDDDNNRGKTLMGNVNLIPVDKVTANLHVMYGPEAADQTHQKRTSVGLVLGDSGIDKLSLNLQGNWGQDKQDTVTASTWKGVGLWAGYSASDYLNPGVRFEVFDDSNGGSRTGIVNSGGVGPTVKDITFTNKFKLTEKMFIRAEYRHDFSNAPAFQNKDGNTVRVQNTLGADWVVLF